MTEHKTLTAALAAFQADLPKVGKGSINPHFKSRYAALEDIVNIVLPKLAAYGLAWVTMPTKRDDGEFVLRYELRHDNGDVLSGDYPLSGGNAQQRGSEITYARRYTLCAVVGIAPDDDDDGNAASQPRQAQKPPAPTKMTAEAWKGWSDRLEAAQTSDEARAIWQEAQKLNALNHVTPSGEALGAVIQRRAAEVK